MELQRQNINVGDRELFDDTQPDPLLVLAELCAFREFLPPELKKTFDEAVEKYVKEKGIDISKEAKKPPIIQRVSRCLGMIGKKR